MLVYRASAEHALRLGTAGRHMRSTQRSVFVIQAYNYSTYHTFFGNVVTKARNSKLTTTGPKSSILPS